LAILLMLWPFSWWFGHSLDALAILLMLWPFSWCFDHSLGGRPSVHPSSVCYNALATGISTILEPVAAEATASSSTDNTHVKRPSKRPRWLDLEARNTVAPRGTWRGPQGPWRGFQRGRSKNSY
jgi:hypothetical protein